jgi:hypothetical protein
MNLKWTLAHGFYVNMGGIAIDANASGKQFLPDNLNHRYFLPSKGVEEVAMQRPGLLAGITSSQILDKSKSSLIGKTITCLQAFWFVTQCISRLVDGLPISLLEVRIFICKTMPQQH